MSIKIDNKIVGYSIASQEEKHPETVIEAPPPPKRYKRPALLAGHTIKLKMPDYNLYLTVNCTDEGIPFEIFFSSSHLEAQAWVSGLTRLASCILRCTDDKINSLEFVGQELRQVESAPVFSGKIIGKSKPSFQMGPVQYIGNTLIALNKLLKEKAAKEIPEGSLADVALTEMLLTPPIETESEEQVTQNPCPECGEEMQLMDGCMTCVKGCGYSKCG